MIHSSFVLRMSLLVLIVTQLLLSLTVQAKRESREPEAATGFNQKKAVS
ncbi:MAG: gamma-glutamyltranspeptidase/glutathione hydrolase, partial [Colwellia sp.]